MNEIDETVIIKEEKHIRNAWIVGIISAVFTFTMSMIGAYSDIVKYKYGFDTWSLLDVALIAGLTFGVYRKNRFCALTLLIYYVSSHFILAASAGKFTGGVMVVLFGYYFFQGTRASFKRHKLMHKNAAAERKKKGWGFFATITILSIILIPLMIFIIMAALGPGTEVIPGKMLNKKYSSFIRDNGLIESSEEIEYWYSDAFMDFKKSFYFFTNKQVVLYSDDWEEPTISIPFSSILDIDFHKDASFFEDSKITLTLSDSSSMFFPVSSDNNGDDKFVQRMKQIWDRNTMKNNEEEFGNR